MSSSLGPRPIQVRSVLRRASTDPEATDAQKDTALFYLAAGLKNLGRREESISLRKRWLELFPKSRMRTLQLYYIACDLLESGQNEAAIRYWEQLLSENPKPTNLTRLSRWYMENKARKK